MKKKRKGRKIDHLWRFVKYKSDMAIYAKCSCGFAYPAYKNKEPGSIGTEIDPEKLYNYCPYCGARKKRYIPEVEKIDRYLWG